MDKQKKENSIEKYFEEIDVDVKHLYKIAEKAKSKNLDPEPIPSTVLAKDMAERVEGLIFTVAPQIKGKGIPKKIHELEEKYGVLDWRVALLIAEDVTKEKFCKFKDKLEAMEVGIRTGIAYFTLGTVASPLEGFVRLKIKQRRDGKEYVAPFFSGPIRSAGGSGGAVSLLITDYIRIKMGYAEYDPTEDEIKRYVTEVYDYHERITNLQYLPSEREVEFMMQNIPVQLSGDPSEKREVSNYKDLPRVETNRIRNGVCLVIGESICLKAPKVWKRLAEWGKEFGLEHWNFIEKFLKIQKEEKAAGNAETEEGDKRKVTPDFTYIKDLVAGRPVLAHPLAPGGFRLRYGRSRTTGFSAAAISPMTMVALQDYIATGTQLRTERPGKSTTLTPCETLEGPIVKLKNGDVLQFHTEKQAKENLKQIEKILFLGDILYSYGDFLTQAHQLIPSGYCPEWWIQEFESKIVDLIGSLDLEKISELTKISTENLDKLIKDPFFTKMPAKSAIQISLSLKIPLHPDYTYHWNLIKTENLTELTKWLKQSKIEQTEGKINKIILPIQREKLILEAIGMPHKLVNKEFIVIDKQEARALLFSLGIKNKTDIEITQKLIQENLEKTPLEILNLIPEVSLRDKSGYFIGARMGRPEKAKMRKLTGSPHVLFPVGEEGGRLRSFNAASEKGTIRSEFPVYYCKKCDEESVFPKCDTCGAKTKRRYFCKICGTMESEECKKHGKNAKYKMQDFNIKEKLTSYTKKLKMNVAPDLIKGIRETSNANHTPEHLMKGILRAHHNVCVNKDGTIRFDMTQQPITHFKPKEVDTSVERLKELGYYEDIEGKPLENTNQILELFPQDIILPKGIDAIEEGAHLCFFKVANFMDDLLKKFYGLQPYYNLKTHKDLVGHLITLLAPHTSAAIVGRIIGFSDTQGLFASPMIHAATRRDCDGDEACAMLLLDNLINFSKEYLPAHRGARQDAPLVITSKLVPKEIDDQILDLDVSWKYPLSFYNACSEYKMPWEISMDLFKKRLDTPKQYYDIGFTHPTKNINSGARCSAYKLLPSMQEKLMGQMDLADKICAADEDDVARIVIEKHFIRDIKGNLRQFATQGFRCVKCNTKYRRPPLSGKCDKCYGGKIIFTVSEGSIVKYLGPTISLSKRYKLSPYLNQTIFLTKRMIENIFGKEKEKQVGLGMWFS